MPDALAPFSPATQQWFRNAFGTPTAAQEGAWESISKGENALIIAPTGSGKTLAAFLWALDALYRDKSTEPGQHELTISTQARKNGNARETQKTKKQRAGGTRILYVSPLKALGADVERNLRAPLAGIAHTAKESGRTPPDITVGIRSGDTPARERRQLISNPPDILLTTPESLYLMLTSAARSTLTGVTTVIVDEVHALAGTKRGAHLAVSLERLDQLVERPGQRIGLSATVNPPEAVATFLGGVHPVTIVARQVPKRWDLRLSVPVPDMAALGGANDYGQGSYAPGEHRAPRGQDSPGSAPNAPDLKVQAADDAPPYTLADAIGTFPGEEGLSLELPNSSAEQDGTASATASAGARKPDDEGEHASGYRASIWPYVQERIVDDIENNRSTIVFVNSRGLAEKLTAALNDIHVRRELSRRELAGEPLPDIGEEPDIAPLARAHHGSVAKDQRTLIEESLKNGSLRCVVATSSLELGIDMGHVDAVIQVASPPSVASGLQRVGRAGHRVGEVSRGLFYPKHRGDLLGSAVALSGMLAGSLEPLTIPANPLDVLAQQTVAACALGPIGVDAWYEALRRTAPFANLSRALFDSTLEMLAGRYPSDEFAELRPRIIWDRTATADAPSGTIEGRPGAQRLAVTSGGTIPDRGLFPVYLAGSEDSKAPKRVGELDEEMVYESRAGDVIALGASSWRIEDISHDAVRVSPAPGEPSRLPFWHGERVGRPVALGRRLGQFTRELAKSAGADSGSEDASATVAIRAELTRLGLDSWASDNLLAYIREQREATGVVPTDTRFVVERCRDELGDWRVILHSPYGYPVHAPWAVAVGARVQERYGIDASALAADDGIVLRIPAVEDTPPGAELFLFEPDELEEIVKDRVGESALFASRFRESAARALLLPRRDPGRRTPLWQQRQRSAQLLDVARKYPEFPILLETARECLQDVYDVPALLQLHRDIAARRISLSQVQTEGPSPFARTMLFEYVAEHIYDTDAPAAERRAAALALDPALLAELLGTAQLRDLLDPQVILKVQERLQRTGAKYRARGVEGVADLLRQLGPLTARELALRLRGDEGSGVEAVHEISQSTPTVSKNQSNKVDVSHETGHSAENTDEGLPEEDLETTPHATAEEARTLAEELVASRRAFVINPHSNMAGSTEPIYAAVEDAARLRDGLGLPLPVGIAQAYLTPVAAPLEDLISRYARTHIPFTAAEASAHFSRITPTGSGAILPVLRTLETQNRLFSGEYMPEELRVSRAEAADTIPHSPAPTASLEWVDAEVLRLLRARSLAALRREIEPVPQRAYGAFLPAWQGVRTQTVKVSRRLAETTEYGAYYEPERTVQVLTESKGSSAEALEGREGLLTVIDQLAGVRVPASALETLVLPARVRDYSPQLLDSLLASGEVLWRGEGEISGNDGWVSLHLAESGELTLPDSSRTQALDELGPVEHAVFEALSGGGLFFIPLRERVNDILASRAASGEVVHFPEASEVSAALWRLVWAGLVTNDTFAPVRAMLAGGSSAHPVRPAAPLARPVRRRGAARLSAARTSAGAYPRRYSGLSGTRASSSDPQVSARDSGRFSHISLPQSRPHTGGTESSQEADATVTAYARAELLLDRYGVLTRGALASEDVPGGFAALYRVYAAAEERALVRRGYFIEGLGAAQFASPATVDAVRSYANIGADNPQNTGVKRTKTEEVFGVFEGVLLAATDPANPYGAALTWPSVPSLLSTSSTPGGTEEAAREGTETARSVRHRPGRKAGACLILLDGEAVLYLERGGKTLLSFTADPLKLEAAAPLLARIVQAGIAEKIVVEKLNDCDILATPEPPTHRGASKTDSGRLPEHPVVALRRALLAQGFYTTPRGLRMRRSL